VLAYSLRDGDHQGGDGLLDVECDHRAAVNQAAGLISARIGCSVSDALALIRARAFAAGNDPRAVAQGILNGEVRLV
jgi:AmiR/NasT family two-component response regulator